MLRNLVSSLLEHESITTTVAKAKETQKLAEKVIQWGKSAKQSDWQRANSFLLNPTRTLRPLFTTLSTRYAQRPGGYTRLHRAGNRVGDNAPLAVLELVDGPNDLKFENAAKAVGREMAVRARGGEGVEGWWTFRRRVEAKGEKEVLGELEKSVELEELTRKNVVKALAFRGAAFEGFSRPSTTTTTTNAEGEVVPAAEEPSTAELHPSTLFLNRTYHHYLRHLALLTLSTTPTPDPTRTVQQLTQRLTPSDTRGAPRPVLTVPMAGRRRLAGERVEGWQGSEEKNRERGGPISLAKGGRSRSERRRREFTASKTSEELLAGESA